MTLFLFIPEYISAYVTGVNDTNKFIYSEEVENNSYIMMCSYVQQETLQKAGNQGSYNEYERVNIYYLYNEDVEDFKESVKNNTESNNSNNGSDFSGYDVKNTTIGEVCNMPQYRKTMRFFGTIVTFAKYLVPIIIIAFGIMDLYKAVAGAKDDEIKKSFKSIMVRVVAGVFIFLLPGLVQFFFNMLNEWSDYKIEVCCCTECLLNSSCDTNSCSSSSCKIEGMNN